MGGYTLLAHILINPTQEAVRWVAPGLGRGRILKKNLKKSWLTHKVCMVKTMYQVERGDYIHTFQKNFKTY